MFLNSLNLSHPIVGVHIRIEKLALQEINHQDFWQSCLQSFNATVHSLQWEYNFTGNNIVVIHDQGKYGSYGCPRDVCPRIKSDFFSTLDRLGGRVIHYEPIKFGERADKGFASLVEKEFLSRVDHLITVAKGNFQQSLVLRFKKRHRQNGTCTTLC